MPVSYSLDALSDAVLEVLTDTLAAVIIDVLPGIGVDVLADVKVNVFEAAIAALEVDMPTPLREFSC